MNPFVIIIFASVIYYLWTVIYLRIGLRSLKTSGLASHFTYSVVIAARNEEANIASCLDSVLNQTMASNRFEVIVVNDRSEDDTAKIVKSKMAFYSNLSLISIEKTPNDYSPKKYAVTQAINQAKNEIIVYTDADCSVLPTWLDTIDRNFYGSIDIVQGITSYKQSPEINSIFFGLQAIDFISHGITAAGGIGVNLPINSNANNMAFRRTAYDRVGGYDADKSITSADDDLLLQNIWESEKENIHFMVDPDGAVETEPTKTVRGLLEQRKRWGSNTAFYKPAQKMFLAGIFFFYIIIAIMFLAAFVNHDLFLYFIILLAIKTFGEAVLMLPGLSLFGKKHLAKYIVPASLIQLPLVFYAVLSGVFGKFQWKGRVFKKIV